MREIKFRVYDTVEKKYLSTSDYHIYVKVDGSIEANPITSGIKFFSGVRERFVLEQYTGLKDKNGVEIYEGDIVKDVYDKAFEVVFYSTSFRLKPLFKYAHYNYGDFIHWINKEYNDLTITGNIHGGS